jgi:hypothetical protein
MIAVEDVQVRNGVKSADGTVDASRRKVRAKSGLNKAILDLGHGEFRRKLEYKPAWYSEYFVAVPPQNTSRTSPAVFPSRTARRKPGSPAGSAVMRQPRTTSALQTGWRRGGAVITNGRRSQASVVALWDFSVALSARASAVYLFVLAAGKAGSEDLRRTTTPLYSHGSRSLERGKSRGRQLCDFYDAKFARA